MKEKLLQIAEKIQKIGDERISENKGKNEISLSSLTFLPFGLWIYYIKSFAVLCCIFAPLMAVLSFATNNSIACGYQEYAEVIPFKCDTQNIALYVTFFFLRLLMICVFLKSWYRIAVKHEFINVREVLLINNQDWKLFAAFVLCIMVNLTPVASLALLIARVPNPNWIIESIYFAVVSLGFLLPLFAVRFYSSIAFILNNQKFPSFIKFLKSTSNNGLRLLISIAVLVLFCSVLMLYFSNIMGAILPINFWVFGILGEVLYNVALLAVMVLLTNYTVVQKAEIFKGSEE